MKTKLFLLLTAAMLLLSVNVSAQTKKAAEKKAVKAEKRATAKKAPAGTPLKGDVNEDGVVDVADIAAVIAIMKNGGGTGEETKYYWYVGTTKPTSLSQASTVTSYPEELTYTNNSGAKSHIFVLTNSNKNVTFINLATGNPVDQNEVDTTTISGYKIFETAVGTANTGTIKIRISSTYYWYVGQIMPSDPNNSNQNTGVNKWTQLSSTPSQIAIESQPSGGTWYVAIPHEYGFQAYDTTGTSPDTAAYNKSQININSVSYDLFTSSNQMLKVNAVFKP